MGAAVGAYARANLAVPQRRPLIGPVRGRAVAAHHADFVGCSGRSVAASRFCHIRAIRDGFGLVGSRSPVRVGAATWCWRGSTHAWAAGKMPTPEISFGTAGELADEQHQ